MSKGTLYAVGVGPGDPELMTLKASRIIKEAGLVAYPVGADSGESMARRIVNRFVHEETLEFGFDVPMRVEREPAQRAYDRAATVIASHLKKGADVALLCEGDPFFYGSAMYLVERLQTDFSVEVVPGVTSLTACAASALKPLAGRNETLKVLPAPMDEADLERELLTADAVAIIKVGRHFEKVRGLLERLGIADKAIIVEAATNENEAVRKLSDVPTGERPYFSTILIENDSGSGATPHNA
ncbi:MAG: precorrin-2 C(20)-methyltransferase [Pseudomonadota bacterium]